MDPGTLCVTAVTAELGEEAVLGCHEASEPSPCLLMQALEDQGDALAAADAKGNNAPLDAVPLHRMEQPRGQDRAGRTDRVPMSNGTAFYVHNILCKAELTRNRNHDGGKGLIDLDAFDVSDRPIGAGKGLMDGRDRPKAEHAWFDRGNTVRQEPRHRLKTLLLGPASLRHYHSGGAAIETRCISGGDRSILAECRMQFG